MGALVWMGVGCMSEAPVCPFCFTPSPVKNGYSPQGKRMWLCKAACCGRQFVEGPARKRLHPEVRAVLIAMAANIGKTLTAEMLAKAGGISRRTIFSLKGKAGG